MKTRHDILKRLRSELEQWYIKQCRNPFEDYYLYHMPSTLEHAGGISILRSAPPNPDYVLSLGHPIRKNLSIDQNLQWLNLCSVGTLPVLDIR